MQKKAWYYSHVSGTVRNIINYRTYTRQGEESEREAAESAEEEEKEAGGERGTPT